MNKSLTNKRKNFGKTLSVHCHFHCIHNRTERSSVYFERLQNRSDVRYVHCCRVSVPPVLAKKRRGGEKRVHRFMSGIIMQG